MRAVLRLIGLFVVVGIVATAVGRRLAQGLTFGDDDADEVSMATAGGGISRSLRGQSLRRLRAVSWCGGIDLDLRDARLAPEGADAVLEATMGGIQVTVPETWRVEIERDARAGGIDTRVTDPDVLPSDAPLLRVVARARMGGILVRVAPTARPEPGTAA